MSDLPCTLYIEITGIITQFMRITIIYRGFFRVKVHTFLKNNFVLN